MRFTKDDYYPLVTVRKLREAELLLKLTKDYMVSDPYSSEAMFNSFLQSVWSVTQYLKKELSNFDENGITTGALAWYLKAVEKLKTTRTCRLFWELRTECAHRQLVEPKPIISATLSPGEVNVKIEGFFINNFENKMKNFKDYDNKNLLNLADEHISIIKSIVDEAVIKFGFKDRPLKNFHTKPGYIKLEAKVRAINSVMEGMVKPKRP
jgi:hypothetical protein